jgi:hypothetical protein
MEDHMILVLRFSTVPFSRRECRRDAGRCHQKNRDADPFPCRLRSARAGINAAIASFTPKSSVRPARQARRDQQQRSRRSLAARPDNEGKPIKPIEKKNAATKLMCFVHRSSPIGDRQRREFTNRSVDYLEKWLARNTTGRSAWAFSSKNLRDARSSITSRSRMRDVRPDQRVDQFIYKIRQVARDRISDDQTLGECTGPSDCGRAGTAGFRIVCVVWNTGTARFAGSDCEDIGNCDPAGDRIT